MLAETVKTLPSSAAATVGSKAPARYPVSAQGTWERMCSQQHIDPDGMTRVRAPGMLIPVWSLFFQVVLVDMPAPVCALTTSTSALGLLLLLSLTLRAACQLSTTASLMAVALTCHACAATRAATTASQVARRFEKAIIRCVILAGSCGAGVFRARSWCSAGGQ